MTHEQERARWEGAMEARMADAERRLDAVNGSIQTHAAAVNNLAVKVGGLTVKVAALAGVGSVAGGALVAAAIRVFFG